MDALDSAADELDVGLWAVARVVRTVKIREVNESIIFVVNGFALI